jgi:hypothetical protein
MKIISTFVFIILLGAMTFAQQISEKDFLYLGSSTDKIHDYFLIVPSIEKRTPLVSFLYMDAVDKDNYTLTGAIVNCRDISQKDVMKFGREKGVKFEVENPKPEFGLIKPNTLGASIYKNVCNTDELP